MDLRHHEDAEMLSGCCCVAGWGHVRMLQYWIFGEGVATAHVCGEWRGPRTRLGGVVAEWRRSADDYSLRWRILILIYCFLASGKCFAFVDGIERREGFD
jgi:hypothetical protein